MTRKPSEYQAQLSFTMEPLQENIFQNIPSTKKKAPRKKAALAKKEEDVSISSDLEPALPKIMSVTEVTRRVASLLESGIGSVWIEGEISNYRLQSSGHHYFTLKDAGSQIACVLFARTAAQLAELSLREGMAVQLYGDVTVYQPRGQYQLMVRLVQAKGQGMLQAKFEALKQKLAAEGLFDSARKRLLPRFPRRIGVVTSPTGAALADFLNILHRRHPGLQVVIHPVRVQGQGAAQEIAAAITELAACSSAIGMLDVIVVTRGGGSLEDLWEFNEEIVVRAIATSAIPVVSAVGHEIDFTLADFAADLRAPTPSAAAEILAADSLALLEKSESLLLRIARAASSRFDQLTNKKDFLESAVLFRAPERFLGELRQRIDGCEEVLVSEVEYRCEKFSSVVSTMVARLSSFHPRSRLMEVRQRSLSYKQHLHDQVHHRQELIAARVENLRSSLAALNPDATLARGFTITRNSEGKVIASSKKIEPGSSLQTEFFDGEVLSSVRPSHAA